MIIEITDSKQLEILQRSVEKSLAMYQEFYFRATETKDSSIIEYVQDYHGACIDLHSKCLQLKESFANNT